jgi:hypothetical protein
MTFGGAGLKLTLINPDAAAKRGAYLSPQGTAYPKHEVDW